MKKSNVKKKRSRTFYLLPNNNFLIGIGSVLNIRGRYFKYNYSKTTQEADRKALASDWESVGDDLRAASQKITTIYK